MHLSVIRQTDRWVGSQMGESVREGICVNRIQRVRHRNPCLMKTR